MLVKDFKSKYKTADCFTDLKITFTLLFEEIGKISSVDIYNDSKFPYQTDVRKYKIIEFNDSFKGNAEIILIRMDRHHTKPDIPVKLIHSIISELPGYSLNGNPTVFRKIDPNKVENNYYQTLIEVGTSLKEWYFHNNFLIISKD